MELGEECREAKWEREREKEKERMKYSLQEEGFKLALKRKRKPVDYLSWNFLLNRWWTYHGLSLLSFGNHRNTGRAERGEGRGDKLRFIKVTGSTSVVMG